MCQWQAAVGWFCCLSLMATLVGFAYFLKKTPAHPSLPHAVYQGLHRHVWALSVSWIILACEEGYGGMNKNKSHLFSNTDNSTFKSLDGVCYATTFSLFSNFFTLQY